MAPTKRPTLNDLAETAGCSRALASIVMRDAPGASALTRTRIKEIAAQIGYVPDQRARHLRSGSSGLIGVLYQVTHPFQAEIIAGLYEAAASTQYEVVLGAVTHDRGEDDAIRPLLEARCEALILIGPEMTNAHLRRVSAEIPTVMVAREQYRLPIDTVRVDDAAGAKLAVQHLLDQGHRSIVHVSGGNSPGTKERIRGYRETMESAGCASRCVRGGTTESAGIAAAETIINSGDLPTAIFAFNDRCAVGIQNALWRENLRVPEDVSLVGFDDAPAAQTAVTPLTTIRQNPQLMARLSLERAINQISAGLKPSEQVVVPELVRRASVAQPRRYGD